MDRIKHNAILQAATGVREVYSGRVKYNEDRPRQAYQMIKHGLNIPQIAVVMGVAVQTVEDWLATREDFALAVQQAKQEVNNELEKTLLKVCFGYTQEEEVITGYKGIFTTTTVNRTYPPDGNLCLKVLQARQPEVWCPPQRAEINKNINVRHTMQVKLDDFTDKELEVLESIALKQLQAHSDEPGE